jgi:hypothetical protein
MKAVYLSVSFLFCICLFQSPSPAQNVVTDWTAIIQPAVLSNPAGGARPPAGAEVLHTIIQLAMYDAAMVIEGGYAPYAANISAPAGSDVRAAVATAAYRTARARVAASQVGILDLQYNAYMLGIPETQAKADGVQVGAAAAANMLAIRANDGFDNVVLYQCSSNPPPIGEFQPNGGCGTRPVDVKVGEVLPFTYSDATEFRPDGPLSMTSDEYARDFVETRDFGRSNSAFRSAEQTDIVWFWSENTYTQLNRNLIALAVNRNLNARDTARLFAMAHTSAADSVIAGFAAKYYYRYWRPRTAIPRADLDGNPNTDADSTWIPLLTVNHPEYPSGHGFYTTAFTDAIAAFFGTNKVAWTVNTTAPQAIQTQRTYEDVNALMREVDDARVWAGLHWRHSMRHGSLIGRKVAKHVTGKFFHPVSPITTQQEASEVGR